MLDLGFSWTVSSLGLGIKVGISKKALDLMFVSSSRCRNGLYGCCEHTVGLSVVQEHTHL